MPHRVSARSVAASKLILAALVVSLPLQLFGQASAQDARAELQFHVVERVNVNDAGEQAIGSLSGETGLSVSADGRLVAFASDARNLVPGATSGSVLVYLRDRALGVTELISVLDREIRVQCGFTIGGPLMFTFAAGPLGGVHNPLISRDGRFVRFSGVGSPRFFFERDRVLATTNYLGCERDFGFDAPPLDDRFDPDPTISADGRLSVAEFPSRFFGFFGGGLITLRDSQTGTSTLVSRNAAGVGANGGSFLPVISDDGRVIAFTSFASNLVAGDTNHWMDVFVATTEGAEGADLAIRKTAVKDAVFRGDTLTYTLQVNNNGPGGAGDVVVRDDLPAGVTYASDSCGGSAAGQVWSVTIASLPHEPPANTRVCEIHVQVAEDAVGPLVNSASVASSVTDPVLGNNSSDPVSVDIWRLAYYGLGDSVASGHGLAGGTGRVPLPPNCRRSPSAYPVLVNSYLASLLSRFESIRFSHLACSGAPSVDLSQQVTQLLQNESPPPGSQIPKKQRTLVSITIGANDFNFGHESLTGEHLCSPDYQAWATGVAAQVRVNLQQQIQRLLAHDNVYVVVTDYHNPYNRQTYFLGLPIRPLELNPLCLVLGAAGKYARTEFVVHTLNGAIASAVAAAGPSDRVAFASLHGAFHGRESARWGCGLAEPGVRDTWVQRPFGGALIPVLLGDDCFHPNVGGHQAFAVVVQAIGRRLLKADDPRGSRTALPGSTTSSGVAVPRGTGLATFSSSWTGSDVVMSLVTPSGRTVDRSSVDPDVIHLNGPTFEAYSIINPEAGEWTMQLFGADVPPGGEQVSLSVTTIEASVLDADGDGVLDGDDQCPGENSTGFDANEDGCIDTIEDAIAELEVLKVPVQGEASGVGDPGRAIAEIDAAIAHLSESLDPELRATIPSGDIDPERLDAEQGQQVFHEERHAAQDVFDVIREGDISDTAIVDELLTVVDKLANAARRFDKIAIEDAKANPDADQEKIAEAEARMAEGDRLMDAAAVEPDIQRRANLIYEAIDNSYRHAWEAAIAAQR